MNALMAASLSLAVAAPALAQEVVPPKRFVLSADTDFPGGDLATILDTTLDACQRACLANQSCTAFTFNTRNGSCFPKSAPGDAAFFQGAFSGNLLTAAAGAEDRAETRRGELTFLQDYDIANATAQATGLANQHTVNGYTAAEHLQSARDSESAGNMRQAANFTGAALNITDSAEDWVDYARLLLAAGEPNTDQQRAFRDAAVNAAINGYLRAESPALRHTALVYMGQALEKTDRGNMTVQALRLAQALQPRDDTAALLDDAIGKYGFRIAEHDVQSDSARPRVCATFTEDLVEAGVDYSSFVQLPEPGLTVEKGGWRQLCVEGLTHGARYSLTFREGLPAADGQTMARSVPLNVYVRDRSPGVRFPGRAYVLPRSGTAALPVETVNTEKLDLSLFRVSDRNLLRAMQNDYFGTPIADYQEEYFNGEIGDELWSGTADVAMEVNRDVTTRLPLDEAIAGLPAGIYALKAAVPGVDTYTIPAGWQWFVVSDLGVTTMTGVDGLHVFVRALGTAGAKAGVTVELVSRANAVLGTATTDELGYASFAPGLTRGTGGAAPGLVVVREGDADMAFLSLSDPEFDLSDRGVEGREPAPPVDVFLTTDRGAYRAGETVYATALARDTVAAAVPGLPLTAVLKRPDGVEYSRALVADGGAGGHVFALPVGGSAPRGVWRLEVLADLEAAPLAAKTFLVEDFLPERIDFTLALPEGTIRLGDAPELTIDARYLFGAPGADLAVEGEVLLRAASELPGFAGYVFGRHDEPFDARLEGFSGERTDEGGRALLPLTLPQVDAPGRPLEARVTVRVAEGSGRPVERQLTRLVAPEAALIGVKPMFDDVVAEGTEARFNLIGVGPGGVASPMAVTWELTRIETNYQWYQQYGSWNWEPVISRTRVAEGAAELGTDAVEIAAPVTWGEYELAVERSDGTPAATSTTFYAGWYAPADVSATPDTLELSLDKPAYLPGETAQLRIVPRAAGTALITVLSNRLVSMQAVEVAEGENTIPLTVTDEWGAGVYVTASVLRPMDVAAGRNPARALGLAHAAIDPGGRKLTTTIEAAPEAAPRGPMEVAVKVEGLATGDTAYATIAAVDVGILNLTAFKSPDPEGHYFGQRKLGVGIRDIYGRLIDGLNGAEGVVRSGGDAGAGARLQAPPPTEELVAYFTGPVTVGADGYARASFDLPSFNGTVRVMAVVWSSKAVGQAEADVLVRDPVVVTASLPRFLSPGDESRLLLEIVHATGPSGRMGLDVTANGLTLGNVPSGFDLGDQAKAVYAIPVTAGDVGLHTIDVALTTPDGKQLTKRLTIPVQVNDPELARTSRFDLAAGETFTFDSNVFAGLIPGSASATMAIGPIARLNAPGLLASLDRYPYGCTEQITSKALPLIYFDQVAQAMQLKGAENISLRIEQAVAEVLTNQTSEGGFGLWGPAQGDFWLDAYVTDFLSRARAQGHAVPDLAFRSALDNLRNQVNYQPDFDAGGEALAYALMVLAREGAAAVGDLRYYADVKGDAFSTPIAQAQLGAALASYGDQTRADAMFRKAGDRMASLTPTETAQVFRADYGTNYRDAAAVLTLAVEAGSEAVDRAALTDRIATHSGALSTQEATWALLAANALIDRPAADGITIDGAAPTGPLVRVLDAAGAPVIVANGSASPTTLTVTTYGVPSEPEPAGGNGYAITRTYYSMEGEAASLDGLTTGTRLVTVLEVTPFGSGEARLMLADPLPAGFEIDNPNLIAGGEISALDWLDLQTEVAHSEFRQDRFLTAVDRYDNQPFRVAYIVRAVSPGVFHHPAASVEDMYRPDFRARSDAGQITISE
ncbi:alpha-2-macroglobulin family protein [Fertoebacter nigrum]|uniref:Alpha-2-macroglobulin family protein n=2 Tax=Fertoeibacter niger TaxID=2656921 RepID=A0A8X8H3D6_9RHOB|nr:alpha-2-macroglobulin family protein [Fertoeibacter niger]